MSALSTFIKADTKDYVVINGEVQFANVLLTESYARFVTPLGSYQFDPLFGNELINKINTRVKLTANKVTTMVNTAMQPMIDEGRALSISTTVDSITLNAVFVTINITDNNNNTFTLSTNYIGTT